MIDVVDYEGTRVTCDSKRWSEKIDTGHPELSGQRDLVAAAINDPDIVLQDHVYANRRHMVRRQRDRLYLVVVIEYRYVHGDVEARLVTAFVRSRLRRDDHVIYVKGQ